MQNAKQSQNYINSLHVRVSPAIEERLSQAAKASGLKISAYVRMLLVRSLHDLGNQTIPVWMR